MFFVAVNCSVAPSSAESRSRWSPLSTLHTPRFGDATVALSEGAPVSSVSLQREQPPPMSRAAVQTGRDSVQTKAQTPLPLPVTTTAPTTTTNRCNIHLGTGGSSTTELPKEFPRVSAPDLEKTPYNTVSVLGIEQRGAVDSEPRGERAEAGEEDGGGGDDLRRITWPGSHFKLHNFLPGSVYLWACGEHGEEGQASRPDVAAAWVVVIVSTGRYATPPWKK